ncbi:helix-turn-helix domain-containing protein [Clostridium perfringens]|uniref:helix-turn-helix domain-containing protein n=1 Tax=Clostridium perfringens TaxID=1502 RepID=UPI0024472E8A|nr:helix-turn-helix transcriptional regulator [Clostridium perfringens]MDH2460216.1 helix-turn-helix transcriptional regulator [Clostridium perfringens]MDU1475420.1 helix-turn-helix transcriptional regulator [Clostridium perfringens]MDU2826881.1 helix-turn-helix transcriptional regulator [Clostridium perfringens]
MNNLLDDSKIKNIMNRIQSRRLELKLSYQDLASKTNMSKSTLQRYETGSIKNMPVDKLGIIATALDVSPLWLLGFDENENNNKLSDEEQQHIEDLRKLNDIGKNKVITYTKDLMDNPKFINEPIQNQSEDEISSTSLDDFEPYLLAAHSDGLDEETNKANIEKIKKMYLEIKGK